MSGSCVPVGVCDLRNLLRTISTSMKTMANTAISSAALQSGSTSTADRKGPRTLTCPMPGLGTSLGLGIKGWELRRGWMTGCGLKRRMPLSTPASAIAFVRVLVRFADLPGPLGFLSLPSPSRLNHTPSLPFRKDHTPTALTSSLFPAANPMQFPNVIRVQKSGISDCLHTAWPT